MTIASKTAANATDAKRARETVHERTHADAGPICSCAGRCWRSRSPCWSPILGLFSFFSLQVREYPNLTNTVINVSTAYPGASPKTVQSFITQPLGRVLGQTPDLDYMESSSSQGSSSLTLYMRLNTDQANALANVQTEITQVRDQLPANSHPPIVNVSSGHQTSLMYIALYSPGDVMSPAQITDYVIRNVQPLLQTVNGVSQARLIPGGSGGNGNTLAMRVWLKPDAMTAYGVTPADVEKTLQTQNVITALGTTRNKLVAVPIGSNLSAESVATFRKLVVKTVSDTPVYLDQVARRGAGRRKLRFQRLFRRQPGRADRHRHHAIGQFARRGPRHPAAAQDRAQGPAAGPQARACRSTRPTSSIRRSTKSSPPSPSRWPWCCW